MQSEIDKLQKWLREAERQRAKHDAFWAMNTANGETRRNAEVAAMQDAFGAERAAWRTQGEWRGRAGCAGDRR